PVDYYYVHSFPTRRSSDLEYRFSSSSIDVRYCAKSRLSKTRTNKRGSILLRAYKCSFVNTATLKVGNLSSVHIPIILSNVSKWADRKSTRLNSSHVKISYA